MTDLIILFITLILAVLPFIKMVTSITNVFTEEELELARRYATAFGLDNEDVDVDIARLVEMGRKYETFLGSETMDTIVCKTEMFYRSTMQYSFKQRAAARRHYVNQMVNECSLIVVPSFINTITILGGDRNGEPTIS